MWCKLILFREFIFRFTFYDLNIQGRLKGCTNLKVENLLRSARATSVYGFNIFHVQINLRALPSTVFVNILRLIRPTKFCSRTSSFV